jgi:hypothetical protein
MEPEGWNRVFGASSDLNGKLGDRKNGVNRSRTGNGEGRLVFDRRRFRPAQVGSCAFPNHDRPKSSSPNKLGFRLKRECPFLSGLRLCFSVASVNSVDVTRRLVLGFDHPRKGRNTRKGKGG